MKISESALECILTELFDNAKKCHPQRDPSLRVQVQIVASAERAPRVRISVADDGFRLSAFQLEKLWLTYYRSELSFTGEVPVMGPGLSLVQTLLWQVGGSCRATNRTDPPGFEVHLIEPLVGAG